MHQSRASAEYALRGRHSTNSPVRAAFPATMVLDGERKASEGYGRRTSLACEGGPPAAALWLWGGFRQRPFRCVAGSLGTG